MTNRRRHSACVGEKTNWAQALKSYAAVAGGAAIALGASDAGAEVLYTDVTPDLSTQYITDTASSIDVFFDLDGKQASAAVHGDPVVAPEGTDFRLNYTNNSAEKPELAFQSPGSNWASGQVAKIGVNFDYSNMFGPNEEVGPNYNPPPEEVTTGTVWAGGGWLENNDAGPWHNGGVNGVNGVGTGFLGLRLDFDGVGANYNYGWAQIRYDDNANTLTLLDFAVETELNTAITTPEITPPPVALVGDFNSDQTVDAADLEKWKADFGATAGSDANADAVSDGADFLLWQRNFGSTAVPPASVGAVPEPHSLLLAALGAAGLGALRRRPRS